MSVTVIFSKPMDPNKPPRVLFRPEPPDQEYYLIEPDNPWCDTGTGSCTRWSGTTSLGFCIPDGIYTFSVLGGQDLDGNPLPESIDPFQFEVAHISSHSGEATMGLDTVCVSGLWDGRQTDCASPGEEVCGSVGGYRISYRDELGNQHEYVHPSAQARFDIYPDPLPDPNWEMKVGVLDMSGREVTRKALPWHNQPQ